MGEHLHAVVVPGGERGGLDVSLWSDGRLHAMAQLVISHWGHHGQSSVVQSGGQRERSGQQQGIRKGGVELITMVLTWALEGHSPPTSPGLSSPIT